MSDQLGAILVFPTDDPRFVHIDPVPQTELARFYAEADAFVLASREDGFGVVLAQALASGLPVICTDRTGGADLAHTPALAQRITRLYPTTICRRWLPLWPDCATVIKAGRMSSAARDCGSRDAFMGSLWAPLCRTNRGSFWPIAGSDSDRGSPVAKTNACEPI